MPADSIYLDHNATTPLLPEVADAMREAALRFPGNPASQHELGRQARRALETARQRISEILGAGPDDQLVFTSGGTESNNLALTGLQRAGASPPPANSASRLIISPLEHPSVYRTADRLALQGWSVERLSATPDGEVDVKDFDEFVRRLNPDVRLVSVMLASHETGVLQPLSIIGPLCRAKRVLLHTDATQVVGKLPVNFQASSADAMTFTAHKFHGPVGIGALLLKHGVSLSPIFQGGFQQASVRPGTECVALAIGMQVALEAWVRDDASARERWTARSKELDRAIEAKDLRAVILAVDQSLDGDGADRHIRMHRLQRKFESAVLAGDPRAVVIGAAAPRLPHTSNIAFVGLDRQALMMALDLAGVACSTGSACASGSSEPSPALVAMGLPDEQISSSIRFSLGATTTPSEIEEASRRILATLNRLRLAK